MSADLADHIIRDAFLCGIAGLFGLAIAAALIDTFIVPASSDYTVTR